MRFDFLMLSVFSLLIFGAQVGNSQEEDPGEALSAVEAFEVINDIKVLAQKAALPTLAGDEKFVLRESWWGGSIDPGKAKLHQVQLFKRNSYKFWLAVPDTRAELNLNIYNSEGQIVPTETANVDGTNIVSTVVSPELTGIYFVRISLKTTIDVEQDYAVIYAYR
tara:strand:+ start:4707 stop:5201 length:495 start_codon:yes stop_codon:yes gene_type:complete